MSKRCYKIHDFYFSLATNCEHASILLEQLFPAHHEEPTQCSADWYVLRGASDHGETSYSIYADDRVTLQTETLDKAIDHIEWSITVKTLQAHRHLLQIHAAALAFEDRAVVIAGPPGAGKSSLALSLLSQGWKFLSDEIAFIDPSSCRIFSFPRNLHISSETLRYFPVRSRGDAVFSSLDASGKTRIDAALLAGTGTSISARPWLLVFPDHRQDYIASLAPLGKTASLALLSAQALNLGEFGIRGLEALTHFVGLCDTYMLMSRDLLSASALLSHLVKSKGATAGMHYQSSRQQINASDSGMNITVPSGAGL